ncbi:MAG: hypothetical protein KME43_01380 [Myxacorys chilensis ATA2-1-KO14]|nr:hypothetical protein [Myxacorys chilensis ATA2-1-KO14]
MSAIQFLKSRKSLAVFALLNISIPLFTLVGARAAHADSNFIQCVPAMGINVCVEANTSDYSLYTQSGSLTSQKVALPVEGGCPVFGGMDTAKGRLRVEGCVTPYSRPPQLQGVAQVCNAGNCQREAITLNFPNRTMLSDDRHLGAKGYEYYLDGELVARSPSWSRRDSVTHLELAKKTYPNRKVEGYFDGQKIGYELFWDGVRVGFEPSWSREQAIANLQQNKKAYPNKRVEGILNGQKVGYELFWGGLRVGFEPNWNQEQAIANLQWNKKAYPNKSVYALLNGETVYLPSIPVTRPTSSR